MKKYLLPFSIMLLFVFVTSCKGQKKTDTQKEVNKERPISKQQPSKPQSSKSKPSDYDTYFVESDSITSPNGPTSITRNILQDRNGNIWLSTWEGIIRYDASPNDSGGRGKTFTNFTNKDSLRRFHVFSLLEDSKGNIWFGTIGAGVYFYDGKTFTNFTTKDGLADDKIGCFLEDSNGTIWIGTMGGVSCYDGIAQPNGQIKFRNFTKEDGLTDNDINSIVEDKNGKLWFGTRGYACTYDASPNASGGRGEKFTKLTYHNGLPFVNVRCIIEDSNGNIWLGGNDGLWQYDPSKKQDSYTKFAKNFVGYIYEDSKGNIWTSSSATGNANKWTLSRYDLTLPLMGQINPTEILTKTDMFFGITEDKDGGIWLGTLNGVCRYDGKSFEYFRNKQ